MKMEGAPGGGGQRTVQVCLTADELAAAPEQVLIDAAGKQGGGSTSPVCDYRYFQRSGERSTWQAVCEGPMGKMQGTGSGRLSADHANLQQAFVVKSPIGTLNLQQLIGARRVGGC